MATVQSISRAFSVLKQLSVRAMGITELAESVSLPKSTVARLIKTLETEGAVERADERGTYRLGGLMATLAGSSAPAVALVARARPHLEMLAASVGEDAGLSVADGYRVHYIDQVDSENPVQVRDWTDESVPMHTVPSGLVILSLWPVEALDRFLSRPLEALTHATVTDPSEIRRRLGRIKQDGHAWVFEEFAEGINSVAAPLLDPKGRPAGAIHVHGPAYRFPEPGSQAEVTRLVIETAGAITAELAGGRGPSAS